MKDFFAFRLMITAGLIKVIYPIGALAIFGAVFFVVPKNGGTPSLGPAIEWDRAILFVLFANIGWRIFCEQMILLFSIHESLNRKKDGNG
jgi:Domain of unknown function (DUF4282)